MKNSDKMLSVTNKTEVIDYNPGQSLNNVSIGLHDYNSSKLIFE